MDFTAIDFETANSRADSACQLALVKVRGGEIVDEHCWLIRPPRLYFSPRNIAIHGIKPDHVSRADTMSILWQQLSPLLADEIVVAHNARFDIGVLTASLAAFDIACPPLDFSCTRAIAKQTWPHQPRYGLAPLGAWLGITFRHHDALEDARCCAQIAIEAARTVTAVDFSQLEQKLRLTRGRYALGRIAGPRSIGGRATASSSRRQLSVHEGRSDYAIRPASVPRGSLNSQVLVESSGGNQPLKGKRILFLGSLRGMSPESTRNLAERLGATCVESIQPDTDYVIACGGTLLADAALAVAQAKKSRIDNTSTGEEVNTASEPTSQKEPSPIRVLSERQFLAFIPGGKAAVQW
ncbi:MAG: exonuclease domain-containing protein [Pirellulales bacterium]